MTHYSPWPVNIKGGFLGIDYNGDVYMLADGKLYVQGSGGIVLNSTSTIDLNGGAITLNGGSITGLAAGDITFDGASLNLGATGSLTMTGGDINMTGGEIDLDSGENYIHLNPTSISMNGGALNLAGGNINLDSGHLYAKLPNALDMCWLFGTANGEQTALNNPGGGLEIVRSDADHYGNMTIYLGSIKTDNAWDNYLSMIPAKNDGTKAQLGLYSEGDLYFCGVNQIILGYSPTTPVYMGYGSTTRVPGVSTGSSAPSSTPSYLGQMYVESGTFKRAYIACGTSSSADWKMIT